MSRGFYFLYTYLSTKRERRLPTCDPKIKEARKAMMLTSLLAIYVCGRSLSSGEVTLQSFMAQATSGTMSTTVAKDAVVTREGLAADKIEDTEAVGESPDVGLVEPHKWRMDDELCIHCQVERDVKRADKRVAAVRIATEISLGDACNEVTDATFGSVDSGHTQKKEITTGHERVWWALCGLLTVHENAGVGEGAGADGGDERRVEHVPRYICRAGDTLRHVDLLTVLLPVEEGQCVDLCEVFLGPKEARGGVLSTTENDERGVVTCTGFHSSLIFQTLYEIPSS